MRALVVYESMYGNTHVIADHIAEGLRRTYDVDVLPVIQATPERVAAVDLVVVGGPTHVHGMSSRKTRDAAVEAAAGPKLGLVDVDPDARGEGLRDWFKDLDGHGIAAAGFDTRIDMPSALTGRASGGIVRRLHHAGFRVITGPTSFFVTKRDELVDGEAERAVEWGASLALVMHYAPTP